MYPLGQAVFNDREAEPYDWSADNLKEVRLGILKKAGTTEELAAIVGASAAVMRATLDRWNAQWVTERDEDFDRPKEMMTPIRTPPYYVAEIWPVVSNTQGGPRHDDRQRVLDTFGQPIPRLYTADELGSIWGSLYLGGGNLSECFITGRIAARDVAEMPVD